MKIGQAAKAAAVNVQTMRYYEKRGLIQKPARRASGYRIYSDAIVEEVRFIKRAQKVGFTLDEIFELLALRPNGTCADMSGIYREKLAMINAKIEELRRFRSGLVDLAKLCGAQPDGSCRALK